MPAPRPVGSGGARPPRLLLAASAFVAVASLLVAVEAGLDRLNVGVVPAEAGRAAHGALMVNGFVGTVISLERARASHRWWAYLVPLASGMGATILLLFHQGAGQVLFVAAALGLAALMTWFWRLQPQLPLLLVVAGALAWAGGGVTWIATGNVIRAVPWWGAFLVLTILGERLELTRFARRSTAPARGAAALMAVALALSAWDWEAGVRVLGVAFAITAAWLLWADTARRTISRGGLARYAGAALLAAYAWLLVAGLTLAVRGLLGPSYDATLHALFVGFVIGAIFAHGPIILPALTGRGVTFTPLLPAALAVLHASVALRVAASILEEPAWRQAAGAMHAVAFALYIAGMAGGVLLHARAERAARHRHATARLRTLRANPTNTRHTERNQVP